MAFDGLQIRGGYSAESFIKNEEGASHMTIAEIKNKLEKMERYSIQLKIEGEMTDAVGSSHFGGVPDVPDNFVWPIFETDTYDDKTIKPRPLSFIAQFNCQELAAYDRDGLLPQTGLLSFFYETNSQRWGFDPKDAGCARVYWFEDVQKLSKGTFPKNLEKDFRFPAINMRFEAKRSLPEYKDFAAGLSVDEYAATWNNFDKVIAECYKEQEMCSKLLGWANIIQNCMTCECELVSKGYYLGNTWKDIPKEEILYAKMHSCDEWLLLFQLDSVEKNDFELMFGDCGSIYYYIRKEDLASKNFDRVWLIQQCY